MESSTRLPVAVLAILIAAPLAVSAEDLPRVSPELETLTAISGRSPERDWWQARTAFVPGEHPLWVTTMSETGREGTHNFLSRLHAQRGRQ